MSMWWDGNRGRYRTNLVHKVFLVWTWPVSRWIMFHCMPSERAHIFAMHWAIPFIGRLDRLWELAKVVLVVAAICVLRLIACLPGFSWGDEK